MSKRIFLLSLFLMLMCGGQAQSIVDVWRAMPDTLLPILGSTERERLTENIVGDSSVTVRNLLGDISRIDSLKDGVLSVNVSESYRQQLCLLPTVDDDSLIGLVETYLTPDSESRLTIYNRAWKKLSAFIVQKDWMLQRPDTLTDEAYHRALLLAEPLLTSITLENGGRQMRLKPSGVLLSLEDKKLLDSITHDTVLRWDGNTYVP